MRRFKTIVLLACFVFLSSFAAHKFYVAIYQIKYNDTKQRLEITCRIFVDDLNKIIEKKTGQRSYLGEKNQSEKDVSAMKSYIMQNFSVEINGTPKPLDYRTCEIEDNVMISYFTCNDIAKISRLEVTNKILFDLATDQQNIIQTTIRGKKENLLLTGDNPSGIIKLEP